LGDRETVRADGMEPSGQAEKPMRADARRSYDALLAAAKSVFGASGVDAPIREIAEAAGVGLGTLYRHFPKRADLIAAVFRREIDDCVAAAEALSAQYPPCEALSRWMRRYAEFMATKRGLANALHSGDPAFDGLKAHVDATLRPALDRLLKAASDAGQIRSDVCPNEFLGAAASVCMGSSDADPARAERMVALLVDGLRQGAPRA
jgi:AcrR family transcriptional regulator